MSIGSTTAADLRFKMMQDSVDAVLKAWDRELQLNHERLVEEGKKLAIQADEASREAGRAQAQQAMDAALDSKIASYLSSLLDAASDPSTKVAIPEGFRAATSGIQGPALPDFSALVAEIEGADARDLDDPVTHAQASAAWAMGHGFMPHPADLSQIMKGTGVDPSFSARLDELGGALSKIESKGFVHPQLKVAAGTERLDTLKEYVDTLSAYGSGRLAKLLSDPGSLTGLVEPAMAAQSATSNKRMPEAVLGKVLDGIFKR